MRLFHIILVGIAGLIAWLGLASAQQASPVSIVEVDDLQLLSQQSADRRIPILIEFSSPYCSYCEQLEEDFLKPMLISGDYTDKVIIRKMDIDGISNVVGFNGEKISPEALADRYNVFVTPTVVLVDAQGNELAEKLVGLTIPDFYGGYLDDAINASLDRLRPAPLAATPAKISAN